MLGWAAALLLAAFPALGRGQLGQAQGDEEAQSWEPILRASAVHKPVVAANGMVVSQHALASQVGRDILQSGGNAVDAAIAVGFALAVVLPRAGNLGGGGFMVVHMAGDPSRGRAAEQVAIDYRERAPAKAHRDIFLGPDGKPDPNLSRFSPLSVGVPGTVAGMHEAHRRYATLPWPTLIAPAIRLAERGFAVTRDMHLNLKRARHLQNSPAARAIFYDERGEALRPGAILRQPDLGRVLREIAEEGWEAFYEGRFSYQLADWMREVGGLIRRKDLTQYKPSVRQPVRGRFRNLEVVSMPPPSSGGVHLLQMLHLLERRGLTEAGHGSADHLHFLTEAMRFSFSDRARYLGDPDFFEVPMDVLLSRERLERAYRATDPWMAQDVDDFGEAPQPAGESTETTHFSVVDRHGNAVANTYTLNFSYGSGLMVPGTGVILNNEMDDFSAAPGFPNAFGLIGSEANAVAPRKRPLSSMTPTLVLEDGQVRLVAGSPGGPRIITAVVQQILNMAEFGMNVAEAALAPRIHHQWKPDMLFHERGFSPDTLRLLRARGHKLREVRTLGSLSSIASDGTWLYGVSDTRRPDGSAEGY